MKRYRKFAGITVGAVLFLILVGGLVRMTGSGMGCPDWPRCFGQWIPPTDISELPVDYKIQFQVAGKEIADFDAYKTWIEYLNRLVGVVIGFLAILTAFFSWPLRKTHPFSWWFSLGGLALTVVQGGLGAIVVKTNLHVGLITLHMFFALMILACFLFAWLYANEAVTETTAHSLPLIPRSMVVLSLVALGLLLLQILFGTQVREGVDELAILMGEEQRGQWLDHIGWIYVLHGRFYYLVVGVFAYLTYRIRPFAEKSARLKTSFVSIWALLTVEIALGLGMNHFDIPAFMQPMHLLVATLLFSVSLSLAWTLWTYRKHQKSGEVSPSAVLTA